MATDQPSIPPSIVLDLLTRVGALETALLRAQSQLHDMRYVLNSTAYPARDLDDLDRGHGTAVCRHETPIGDFCRWCAECDDSN